MKAALALPPCHVYTRIVRPPRNNQHIWHPHLDPELMLSVSLTSLVYPCRQDGEQILGSKPAAEAAPSPSESPRRAESPRLPRPRACRAMHGKRMRHMKGL